MASDKEVVFDREVGPDVHVMCCVVLCDGGVVFGGVMWCHGVL